MNETLLRLIVAKQFNFVIRFAGCVFVKEKKKKNNYPKLKWLVVNI